MLYTAKQIAEIYGGDSKNITAYTVTQQWIKKGLKHIRGKGNSYLFKVEWVEEFLERQSIEQQKINNSNKKMKISRLDIRKKLQQQNCFVI